MNQPAEEKFLAWPYRTGHRAKIRCQISGSASSSKPPLLFVHGYGAMLEHWNLNVPAFEAEHQVVAVDLLGFGGSEKPDAKYSLALWSEQLQFIIDTLGLRKPVVVGHSVGGAVSLWLAHHAPELPEGLVLVDPAGIFPQEVSAAEQLMYRAVGSPLIGEVLFGLFGNAFGARQSLLPTYHNPAQVTDELVLQFSKPFRDAGAMNAYLAPSRRPENFLLKSLPTPCAFTGKALTVWGKFDKAFPPALLIAKFEELLPQSHAAIIDEAAHCPHHEQASAFNRILKTFLST
ncbi:MAG: alpha/beta fold hydrolase [Rhizobacter sp.]|nr:alpha/beta fold hydrolase [Chlorobiales bacterium]